MRKRFPHLLSLLFIFVILVVSCKKDDPAPLGAQTAAKFLAGEKNASKSWKLRELIIQSGTNPAQAQTLPGCFGDNLYTFTNNDAQEYASTEGTTKCYTSDAIESGNWAFTIDGLILNIMVDDTQTPNGLFSSEIYVEVDDNNAITAIYSGGYTPFPAFVKKLDATNLVLEINETRGSDKATYTLTFTPA